MKAMSKSLFGFSASVRIILCIGVLEGGQKVESLQSGSTVRINGVGERASE